MMKPTLTQDAHYYPFLVRGLFDFRKGSFDVKRFEKLVMIFVARYIESDILDKKRASQEILNSLIRKIERDFGGITYSFNGVSGEYVSSLEHGYDIGAHLPLVSLTWNLKRFGCDLGIRVLDSRNEVHVKGMSVFSDMVSTNDSGALIRLIKSRWITMSLPYAYRNNKIDVQAELLQVARYVPDVEWNISDHVRITSMLEEAYIVDSTYGVAVGKYFGIPVYLRLCFEEGKDRIWRKGAIVREGSILELPYYGIRIGLQYSVHMFGADNIFKKNEPFIDYHTEQFCHERLANILLSAFTTRDLADTIVNNPSWVKWREDVLGSEVSQD